MTESKFFTKDIQNHNTVHIYLFEITKLLLLNEIEMCYWSIYLERFERDKIFGKLEDYLLIVGLTAKVIYLNYIVSSQH